MLTNYLTIAWRNLWRNKLYAVLDVYWIGLLAVQIDLLRVNYQSIKVALMNHVRSLRNE